MHRNQGVFMLILLLGGTALLAGCSGSASAPAAGSAQGPASAAQAQPGAVSYGNGAGSYGNGAGGKRTGVTARIAAGSAIEYTASLSVRVPQIDDAISAATQLVESAGGYVANETMSSDSGAAANLQLKIPVTAYPATLSRLAGLGTRTSETQQAQDVTEQVADVNSQVASDQAAIAQLRALLSHAGSVGDLLTVQNQINSEESSLESIEAQQRALNGQTSYATVAMTIIGPKPAAATHAKPKPPPGLAGGLSAGWRALRITMSWALAVAGAVAPFAAIAALAAFGYFRIRRWILRRKAA
ncbi:MAG TPA: DUF4349 domain-containing protein [Streptosporangiaceae bacterium]